ncbi:hypothetical protein KDA11_04225 [Candidatus Saccharibacteria bacterium]|nr:hypothetical protein [Candidatus Saccharibacteria bacterium]
MEIKATRVFGGIEFIQNTQGQWIGTTDQRNPETSYSTIPSVDLIEMPRTRLFDSSIDNNANITPKPTNTGVFSIESGNDQPIGTGTLSTNIVKTPELSEAAAEVKAFENKRAQTERKTRIKSRLKKYGAVAVMAVSGIFAGILTNTNSESGHASLNMIEQTASSAQESTTSINTPHEQYNTANANNGPLESGHTDRNPFTIDLDKLSSTNQNNIEIQQEQIAIDASAIQEKSEEKLSTEEITIVDRGDTLSQIVARHVFGEKSLVNGVISKDIASNNELFNIFKNCIDRVIQNNPDINPDIIFKGQAIKLNANLLTLNEKTRINELYNNLKQ